MRNKHIGTVIPWLMLNEQPAPYPVLNERAIRATAGILFMIGISTMWYTILTQDRSILYIVLPLFWLHFFIVTMRWTRFSPFAIVGRRLTSNQKPEYVGAIQKRFAWGLGLVMASAMFIVVYIVDASARVLLSICGICLLFMRLESAIGLCVGCKIYYALIKHWRIQEPTHRPACPWGVCTIH
jgi:branched-subunit amino acid transport protein AzlD